MDNPYRDETPMTGDYISNDIGTIAEAIRHKKYGKSTREAMAQSLEKMGQLAMQSISADTALKATAYVYNEENFQEYKDLNLLPSNSIVSYTYGNEQIENAPTANVGTVISFSSRSRLDSDNTKVQLAFALNGDMYIRRQWSNWTSWKQIKIGSLDAKKNIYNSSMIDGIYADLNSLKPESVVVYSIPFDVVKNLPDEISGKNDWCIVFTTDRIGGVVVQKFVSSKGDIYVRYINYNVGIKTTNWTKITNQTEINELKANVETITGDTFLSFSIFPKFAVIGDSYASGLLGTNSDYSKFVDSGENYQWGRMIARMYGLQYTHLAKSGLSTRTWLTDPAGLQAMQSAEPQDLYMLCLGINDYYGLGESYLGVKADILAENDTFYGNYGKIINAIKDKAPKAKIIMYGVASNSELAQRFSNAQKVIAEHFSIPYVDLQSDNFFVSDLYLKHMEGGHPRVPVYGAMSKAIVRLTEKTILKNIDYFMDIGFNH